jgi:alpha-ketoglutarate-dependent taurine dioxygenase
VRTHPETGRKAIFLGDHAEAIEGIDYNEGRALIEELNLMITAHDRVYTHHWSP